VKRRTRGEMILGGFLPGQIIPLFLSFSVRSLDAQVIQTPSKLEVQEGFFFNLKCNYSSQYQSYFWYHQVPGEPPSVILLISSEGRESQLHRPSAQFQDSGNYFCAL
uniref:Ig-like domain-containing protein n=1 Tax=Pseudonaja textilis TaxID=8673 RepID=A0A670ZKD4_PSETE